MQPTVGDANGKTKQRRKVLNAPFLSNACERVVFRKGQMNIVNYSPTKFKNIWLKRCRIIFSFFSKKTECGIELIHLL